MWSFIDEILERIQAPPTRKRLAPKVATSPENLMTQIFDGLDTVGWLGEGSFLPSQKRNAPHRAIEDIRYVRRVLISWLAGRPVSEMASRVGCSDRLIYSILRGALYEDKGDRVAYWAELGLVGMMDTPVAKFTELSWDEFGEEYEAEFERTEPIIICQLCHQIIDNAYMEPRDRTYQCNYIGFYDQDWDGYGGADDRRAFAHLVCHFRLQEDPISQPGRRHSAMIRTAKTDKEKIEIRASRRRAIRSYFNRISWEDYIEQPDQYLLDEWISAGEAHLNPIRGRRRLTTEETHRHWRRILKAEDTT
ncbi:MAG: hypothetical protein HQ478_01060 [Chloroflexi bacterium]|nr:hypothetical protein [Chloroflexota bacterium]